ncbi:MAG: VWA domain-containing protein, partial [Rhodothermales bacterium]|nr:VWA domain-containing protein [Rhodothermales bacterium]
ASASALLQYVLPAAMTPPQRTPSTPALPYRAEVSRRNPGCLLFLIDQSTSMNLPFGGSQGDGAESRARRLTHAINGLLQELVVRCTKSQEEGVRPYFDVGVFGYGSESFGPVLGGALAGQALVSIRELANHPLRLEQGIRSMPDGRGGHVEVPIRFPIWFELDALGRTPMCRALDEARAVLHEWARAHPESMPPLVFNLTDGEATDGDPAEAAQALREVRTQDGAVLLFNVHLSERTGPPVLYPSSEDGLPDPFARQLFSMSSPLPPAFRARFQEEGLAAEDGARAFIFNAGLAEVIRCLDIGTRLTIRT